MILLSLANALPNLKAALENSDSPITSGMVAGTIRFDFDVIIGMDWLASHRATIDCYARTVIFGNVRQPEFVYHGSSPLKSVKLISADEAHTMIEWVPREIEFGIEVNFRAKAYLKGSVSYGTSVELKEFKGAIQEMLENGFIRTQCFAMGTGIFLEYLENSVIVFIDRHPRYSQSEEEHERHLWIVLRFLDSRSCMQVFSKCKSGVQQVAFLGHNLYLHNGVIKDPSKVNTDVSLRLVSAPSIRLFHQVLGGLQITVLHRMKGMGCVLMQHGKLAAVVVCIEDLETLSDDGKQTDFSFDDDDVVWFEDRLCVLRSGRLRFLFEWDEISWILLRFAYYSEKTMKQLGVVDRTNQVCSFSYPIVEERGKLKEARSRQKSSAEKHRRDLEFQLEIAYF
ncbi:putative reverse transcriptase domain-containing protein [Tanacetum coccineum]